MTAQPAQEALARLEHLLFNMQVLESFIARREAGVGNADDRETADALVHELFTHQHEDGSWGSGSLLRTAEALLLLADLRPFDADIRERVALAIQWLRGRQSIAGAFADDCSPTAHERALCHHFTTGFFSPGPHSVSFAGTALTNGARFLTDSDARLALSAVALRAVMDYQAQSIDDGLQLDALRRVAELLFRESVDIGTTAAVTVLTTLARAPRTPGRMAVVHNALTRLAGAQRADGSWPGAEPFHVAEAYLIAAQSGYGSPVFDAALSRTADMLMLSQQADGSWGHGAGPFRLLTAWRTLRYVTGLRSSQRTP